MGREALIAALCCLLASGVRANSVSIQDQVGAESARLYRHAPGLVYASAAPYAAYSFHVPSVVAPQPAASRIVPVKDSHSVQYANGNGYLKDSYGNRFVEALQSMKALPFRPFPQQYVQLQELPAHLAQPLAASFQQQQYRAPHAAYRQPAAAPQQHYTYASQHAGYADALKNLQPAAVSYGPHFGSVFHLPVQSASPTRQPHKIVQFAQDSTQSLSENQELRSAPHQSGHRSVFIEQPREQYHHLEGEHKFQRLQEAPRESSSAEEVTVAPARYVKPKPSTHELVSEVKEIPIPTVVNGKKTVVNVKTKPPLPLLDINLLEPLTFANPLVPQVQHFLPRINEATYHKLPGLDKHEDKKYQKEVRVQKTKSYDSGPIKGKKKTKKKQKSPPSRHYDDDYVPAATASPPVSVTKMLQDAPEIVYEINTPNRKETIKEKSVTYNKETNSEPVTYTYGTNTRKEPVQYSYSHSSKEPVRIQEVHYEGKGPGPKHLIYSAQPGELSDDSAKHNTEADDSGESDERAEERPAPQHKQQKEHRSSHDSPTSTHHYVPEHSEHEHQEHHPRPGTGAHHSEQGHHPRPGAGVHHSDHEHHPRPGAGSHHNDQEHHPRPGAGSHHGEQEHRHDDHSDSPRAQHEYHNKPSPGGHQHEHAHHHNPGHHGSPGEHEHHHRPHPESHHSAKQEYPTLEVTPHEYEEDISYAAPIKVDPGQHVRGPAQQPHPHQDRPDHSAHRSQSDSGSHRVAPAMHVHEKTKQVYIEEERPEDEEALGEELMKKIFGKEEDKEKDFENAYKNAAYGFPAYDKPPADVEKDIYDPQSYGAPPEHSYNIDHAPFEQYQGHGDDYPKQMRLSYQDVRDKTKEDYFLDYSVSKPESLLDRHKNKVGYYKLYKDQKPEKYIAHGDDNKQKSAKLTAIPYSYYPVPGGSAGAGDGMKQFLEQYKAAAAPYVFEYDYSKGFSAVPAKPAPAGGAVDSAPRASRPLQHYKLTQFVEPQFQYGFEPVGLPRLLDSELAAMASNHSPDEKPGTRKKVYKENFYIKKTSMSDATPNS